MYGHSPQANLRVRDHHTGLHDVVLTDFHLQAVVDHFEVQSVFRHLAGHDLILVVACEQRQHRCGDFHVVDTAVSLRQQRTGDLPGAVVHRAHHIGACPVRKPCVHVLRQQFRLLALHQVVVLGRDAQRRCHLTVEQRGGAEGHLPVCGQIDEVFIDATAYLTHYKMSAHDLAMTMIREILYTTGITATAGIGTNLYLAKLAMDITAKHAAPDKDGVRIAELDEESFRYLLWDYKPLTDFWQTGPGTVRRLEKHGIHTMGELARTSIHFPEILYKEFGVDAEILIDHAWGLEPCGMKEINAYRPETNSLSEGQVLSCPYPYDKARIIVQEMTDSLVFQLTDKGLVTDSLTLDIGYDRENCDKGIYHGPVHIDHYGRTVPKGAHGSTRLDNPTNLSSQLMAATMELFDRIVFKRVITRIQQLLNFLGDSGIHPIQCCF